MTTHRPELRLVIKARNNRLIALREDLGMTCAQAAETIGVRYPTLIALEGLRESPICGDGWRESALKIAAFHGVSPEYIWPDAIRAIIRAKTISVEIGAERALSWDRWEDGGAFAVESDRERFAKMLKCLTPKEQRVIEARFTQDQTYEKVGEKEQLTKERIRQIELTALNKFRRPSTLKKLKELM